MPFEFGEVVLVRFPFTSQTALKQRPAVVVSSSTYNDTKPDVIIMAITSQLHPTVAFGEVQIADWTGANLLKPSAVKPVFARIEQQLILKRLGKLGADDEAQVRQAMRVILG